jgi:hypothetical protein
LVFVAILFIESGNSYLEKLPNRKMVNFLFLLN